MTFNTYLVRFKLYKSPKMPKTNLHSSNLVHFNYKCDLLATELLTRGWKLTNAIYINQENVFNISNTN